MTININDSVKVKLTREGVQQYYAHHEQFGIITDGPKMDADGWYETQLWSVMQIFGPRMFMGGPLMFETTIQLLPE